MKAQTWHKGKVVMVNGDFRVIDCIRCGFKHLDPIPSKAQLKEYYEKQYYKQPWVLKLQDTEKATREQRWASLEHRDILDMFNKHIKGEQKRVLDIGCGNGFFLKFMSKNGWNAFGIEPSPTASEYARSLGIEVFTTTLEEFVEDRWHHYFDAINLRCVLEHVPNPIETLETCRTLLKDFGMICITVPNDFNALQLQVHKRLGKPQWWVAIPDHPNYFDFDRLERLLKRLGFEILLKTTDFPMEMFLLMGDDYLTKEGEIKVGTRCHQKRMNFEMSLPDDVRRNMYANQARVGIGRACIMYAKKVEK